MPNRNDPLDALNDYLDTLAGSPPADSAAADLAPDMRDGVDRFLSLAQQAPVTPTSLERTTLNMPSSPARPIQSQPKSPGSVKQLVDRGPKRLHAWLSGAAVVLLLATMAGGAWMLGNNRGGPSQEPPLQLAAIHSDEETPDAFWPEPLTVEDYPWIAPIAPEECAADPMPYEDFASAKTTDPGPPQGSYDIVGVPDPADAQAAASVLRSWLACGDLGNTSKIRSHYTSDLIFYSDVSIDNAPYRDVLAHRRSEAERQWTIWAQETGFFPLSIIEGIDPPAEAQESFDAAQDLLDRGTPLSSQFPISPEGSMAPYFEARFNPDDAVLLADGRMMLPTRYVYWAEDPWVQTYGFSLEPTATSMAIILSNVDGEWKIDDNTGFIRFGQDDAATESSTATPAASPAATPQS